MSTFTDGPEFPTDGHPDMLATYWLMARERGAEDTCRGVDAEARATYTAKGYQSLLAELDRRMAAGEGAPNAGTAHS